MAINMEEQTSQLLGVNNNRYRGDFIGFQFGEETSASLRVLRVSDGSRYNEDLLPEFSDTSVEIPGADQSLYFNSDYNTKTLNIDVAFDELMENDFIHLSEVFGTKTPKRLIFDERPYKYYLAKVSTPPQFKYICFDEEIDGIKERIYKGEGTINLILYQPFGYSVYNYLKEFEDAAEDPNSKGYYDMMRQWANSTYMKYDKIDLDGTEYDTYLNGRFNVWNAGVKPTDWIIRIPFIDAPEGVAYDRYIPAFTIDFNGKTVNVNEIKIVGEDLPDGITIDSSIFSLVGYKQNGEDFESTRQLFNKYMDSDNFSKILPRQEQHIDLIFNSAAECIPTISYKHIYY